MLELRCISNVGGLSFGLSSLSLLSRAERSLCLAGKFPLKDILLLAMGLNYAQTIYL